MDVAFPVLSGQAGQGEPVQALLEAAGVPFVGPPASAAALRDRSRFGPRFYPFISHKTASSGGCHPGPASAGLAAI